MSVSQQVETAEVRHIRPPFAMIPESLLSAVGDAAYKVYGALCRYADRDTGECWPSNERLAVDTGKSVRTVKRALEELAAAGAIERTGRGTGRHITLVGERAMGGPKKGPSVAHRTRTRNQNQKTSTPPLSVSSDPSLRSVSSDTPSEGVADDARTHDRRHPVNDDDGTLFDLPETENLPAVARERSPVAQAFDAFHAAYGLPLSRQMHGRIGREFKRCLDAYPLDVVCQAAAEMGTQKAVSGRAVEPFVLRVQARRAGHWSKGDNERLMSILAKRGFEYMRQRDEQRRAR